MNEETAARVRKKPDHSTQVPGDAIVERIDGKWRVFVRIPGITAAEIGYPRRFRLVATSSVIVPPEDGWIELVEQ